MTRRGPACLALAALAAVLVVFARPARADPASVLVRAWHASMQSSDPAWEQRGDARRLFARARAADVWWITGTEAQGRNARVLASAARAGGWWWYHRGGDAWIALWPARARRGTIAVSWHRDIAGVAHRHPARGVLRVSFTSTGRLGRLTVLAAHYDLADESNRPIAADLGRTARAHGAGTGLVFAGLDTNMHLRRRDPFFGRPLSTVWARLGHYEPTHCCGETIDTVATFDGDGRPRPVWCHAILPGLHTDHLVVSAGLEVARL